MNFPNLDTLFDEALCSREVYITDHIKAAASLNSTKGIEGIFANAFHEQLRVPFDKEKSLNDIDAENTFGERKSGRLDCYIGKWKVAIEYKAVRLPRLKGDFLFDVSQIASDFRRLKLAKKLTHGLVVVFVYGPMVEDTKSKERLYRAFHNQMFVDWSLAMASLKTQNKDKKREWTDHCNNAKLLKWDRPWSGRKLPADVSVSRTHRIGAICIRAK